MNITLKLIWYVFILLDVTDLNEISGVMDTVSSKADLSYFLGLKNAFHQLQDPVYSRCWAIIIASFGSGTSRPHFLFPALNAQILISEVFVSVHEFSLSKFCSFI